MFITLWIRLQVGIHRHMDKMRVSKLGYSSSLIAGDVIVHNSDFWSR